MASGFLFLRGGPSAEAGQFLRRSGYIANKGRGQHGQRGPCITRARSHPRRAHGHARCACTATNARRQTGAGPGLGAR
eukprot:2418641-Prymnesium_polylepis.1